MKKLASQFPFKSMTYVDLTHNVTWLFILSDETKAKLSEVMTGKEFTEEHRKNISISAKKRNPPRMDDEIKSKISETMKGVKKPKIKCPHCDKECQPALAYRWHFDNCKHK